MCNWGNCKTVEVKIPSDLSHTGLSYWKKIGIDACIADLVEALQKEGLDMRASCCGHNKGLGRIDFQDGRVFYFYLGRG